MAGVVSVKIIVLLIVMNAKRKQENVKNAGTGSLGLIVMKIVTTNAFHAIANQFAPNVKLIGMALDVKKNALKIVKKFV
jgi:hypothetical protein